MKNRFISIFILICTISFSGFSQTENDEPLLGLPGDDLDLYAVLDLFQKSKTIEDFEESLNNEELGINNLDLNNDGYVDFIKVETQNDGDDYLFILQDPINEKETQDVAVISVSKDNDGNVSMQIIGDVTLYGKDYIVEPITKATASVTSNPGYVGNDPVTTNVQGTTEVIVVEAVPVVQYVYSPYYVHYYPTYYYGYYPYYYRRWTVTTVAIYRHRHYHHHNHYHHGGHHHSPNYASHYNKSTRNSSSTVNNNIQSGNFNTAGKGGSSPSTSQSGNSPNATSTSNKSTSPSSSNKSAAPTSTGSSRSSSGGRAGGNVGVRRR
jgi:hypothetical protein